MNRQPVATRTDLTKIVRSIAGVGTLVWGSAVAQSTANEWPTHGHDAGAMRYSPLTQISPANVASLRPAWSYHLSAPAAPVSTPDRAEAAQIVAEGVVNPVTGARRRPRRGLTSELTPIVAGGLMYVTTTDRRVVALEPETGREVWSHQVTTSGAPGFRGVEYWPGDRRSPAQILFGTRDGLLMALNARTGEPVAGFGIAGVVDLKTPAIMNGNAAAFYSMTSPPVVYRNLVITGAMTQEYPAQSAAGDVRAWDVTTGQLMWTFHTVPRPGNGGATPGRARAGRPARVLMCGAS